MALTVYIGGVDRSAWVELGVRRSMTISGGSKASCTFRLNNSKGREIVRPDTGAEVVVWNGETKWFAGIIDHIDEVDYTGTVGLDIITVSCVDFGALCDRRLIGRVIEPAETETVNGTMALLAGIHPDLGLNWVPGTDPGVELGKQVYNWCTLTEAFNQVAQQANCDWRVDFDKNLFLFDKNSGYGAAPFAIEQDNGLFAEPHLVIDMARYRNRVGVRTNADIQGLQSARFTGDGAADQLQLPGQASGGTFLVNGVEVPGTISNGTFAPSALPTAGGSESAPGWMPLSIVQLSSPPASGATVEANYDSPLSLVAWAQDAGEIAVHGLFECVEEVRDVADADTLQTIANELLLRRMKKPTTLTFRTYTDGLEPGMALAVNLTRPALVDGLLITSVSTEEQGKAKLFVHEVTATNQTQDIAAEIGGIASDLAYLGRLSKMRAQPKDRIIDRIGFNVAETIEGFTNPGLTEGEKLAVNQCQKSGVVREITLVFNAELDNPATITVLKNGSPIGSITATTGSTVQRLYPWGAGGPVRVTKGDIITYQADTTEPSATDGHLELVVVGG